MSKKIINLAALLLALIMLLSACNTGTSNSPSDTSSEEQTPTESQPAESPSDDKPESSAVPTSGKVPEPGEAPEANNGKEKVIFDTDMGILNDDAIALFMLLNSPDLVDVLGIVCTAGNTWVEEGIAYTLRQLEIVDRTDVPVYEGTGEPLLRNRYEQMEAESALFGNSEYIGAYSRERPESYLQLADEPSIGYPSIAPQEENAIDFIVEQVKKYPGEITVFILGPGSTMALAVKKNPEIVPLIKQVYYMGGAIDIPGNTTPAAEFNWWFDPVSIKMLLNTPFNRQVIVPNDIAEEVFYTKEIYDRITSVEEQTPITELYVQLQESRFEENPDRSSYVWDSIVSAYFLNPDIATDIQQRYIDIDVNYGPNYGRAIGYHESRNREFDDPSNFPPNTQLVDIIFDIDRDAFWDLYVELMTKSMS